MVKTELLTTSVDLARLITTLGSNLYSTPSVVLRELVQNAHDSCVRRRIEHGDAFEPKITVRADRATKTLVIEDTGSGLTRDEIIDCLATVGSGYTRALREKTSSDELIGAFGLGFLSAYVVGSRVSVWTCSASDSAASWRFVSTTGETFTLGPGEPRPVGTTVTLTLREKFESLADPARVEALVRRYCGLLAVPITVGDGVVNAPPPWRDPDASPFRSKRAKLDFAQRFEPTFAPLATLDLGGAGDGGGDLAGLLWIQDGSTYGTSDNRRISVFVRGMLVSGDARELLPRWAGFVGGVVESTALVPTASREDLVKDAAYGRIAARIEEQLIGGLAALAKREPEAWRRTLARHNEALLGAALCDPRLFDLLADELTVPTSEGDLRVRDVLARSEGRIHLSTGDEQPAEGVCLRALKVPIATGSRYAVLPFLERYAAARRGEIVRLGTAAGNRQLFPEARVDAAVLAWLEQSFGGPGRRVVAARFSPRDLPLVLVPDEEARLKERIESDEADRKIASATLALARRFTNTIAAGHRSHVFVNLDSPAVEALLRAREAHPDRAGRAARLLRALADLLSSSLEEVDVPRTLADFTGTVRDMLETEG